MENKINWDKFEKGVFLVNVLGVVYNPQTKKVLIGLRKNDPHIKELSWCFPGGRPGYEKDLEHYLEREIKKKTNLDVKDPKIIFAKTYPEKREFLSMYYITTTNAEQAVAGEKFTEVKWIKPTEVTKYFTTSLHSKLYEFLEKLEKEGTI